MGQDPILRSLAIQFDRNNGTFLSGELLSGRILADFTQPKQIKSLRLVIVGESVVQWFSKRYELDPDSELYEPNHIPPNEVMTGREEYFSSEFYLLGSESGSPFMLPAGQMSYKFKFQLPIKIPCSFEHELGYVRYTVKAIFERPWDRDHEVKTTFNVISPYDLNRKLEASLAIRDDIIKNFFCSCICPTGTIYTRFSVPSVGFQPGQVIPVTVHCENESTVDVTRIKVSLQRKLKFYAKSTHWTFKSVESIVAETERVAPFTNNSEERVTIRLGVPPLPPTGLEHCGLIDVDYALRIVMCFSGMHFSVKRCFPIVIGTVPLYDSVKTRKSNMGHSTSSVKSQSGNWNPQNLPPRKYDTSFHAFRTIGERNDSMYVHGAENPFAPRYSVFDCGPSVQSLVLP